MSKNDKETFKDYAQRWREIVVQVSPPLEEKEMTKLFLKTLSLFYYDRMVASAPSDFIEMVNMGMRLEEGVREGRLMKESGLSGSSKRHGNGFSKNKEHDANNHQHNRVQRQAQFDPILMSYVKLYVALIQKSLVHTRTPPAIPKELPWWYKSDHHCEFYRGASGHDIDNCLALKTEVIRLVQSGILSFEDSGPNVQVNPFPKHGGAIMNMIEGCLGKYRVFDVNLIRRSLVEMHAILYELSYYELIDRDEDKHCVNVIVPHFNIPEPVVIAYNSQKSVVSPLVIRLAGPTPYESDKVVPYKYNSTMLEDGKEVPIPPLSSVINIVDVSGVTRSGRVFASVPTKRIEDTLVGKQAQVETLVVLSSQSSGVFEKAYVDHDVTIGQFNGIVAKITACNNLALDIYMNCQEDALSNVLVDTDSSLNFIPKFTLSKLSYQGALMRFNGVVVKAFDGSRKTMIGEVDLSLNIGPCSFQITFQVMDIHPTYSGLLGHPWIHEARPVMSTFHQKLKFVKNEKLVIVGGEHAMLVSHLSSFSYIGADEAMVTPFQALSTVDNAVKKNGESMTSLKDA
ncbi:uncharacterized protein LOC127096434 [Lathyrus oleraceus]|uniref:uncharacterized protein LOC127096434 n=1 Tax=Pisum sativum TaxID=3888 RepID=UPI0021D20092|nr:uncharacterized protein LOC127096434 [Pisum sativum]